MDSQSFRLAGDVKKLGRGEMIQEFGDDLDRSGPCLDGVEWQEAQRYPT